MFVKGNETFRLPLWYRVTKSGRMQVRTKKSDIPIEELAEFTNVNFSMRQLNWTQANDILRGCRRRNMTTGNDEIDWEKHRLDRMVKIVAAWDAKDDSGHIRPVTPENVMGMYAQIGDALLGEYDRQSTIDDEAPE